MDAYIGMIIMFGGNFAIKSYSFCNGQLIAIQQNSALFSILGTTYGGDGRTTFALPDLRGRVPINTGGSVNQGPGLSTYRLGQRGGAERHTLNAAEMPTHSHTAHVSGDFTVSNAPGTVAPSENTYLGASAGPSKFFTTNTSSGVSRTKGLENATVQVGNTGGNQAFDIRQPYLAINFEIALYGIFPSRN